MSDFESSRESVYCQKCHRVGKVDVKNFEISPIQKEDPQAPEPPLGWTTDLICPDCQQNSMK